jgi:predicted nucleic acid-binding protein
MAVSPGDREGERKFIQDFDNELFGIIPDPSDAVLLVAALRTKTNVLTRDKHHLFTTKLENYISEAGIKVYNNFPQE